MRPPCDWAWLPAGGGGRHFRAVLDPLWKDHQWRHSDQPGPDSGVLFRRRGKPERFAHGRDHPLHGACSFTGRVQLQDQNSHGNPDARGRPFTRGPAARQPGGALLARDHYYRWRQFQSLHTSRNAAFHPRARKSRASGFRFGRQPGNNPYACYPGDPNPHAFRFRRRPRHRSSWQGDAGNKDGPERGDNFIDAADLIRSASRSNSSRMAP